MKRKPVCLFVFFLLLQRLVQAQESSQADTLLRCTEIEQEQESKAARLTLDKPAKAERDFTKVEYAVKTILETPPAGIRPKFSSSVPNWGGPGQEGRQRTVKVPVLRPVRSDIPNYCSPPADPPMTSYPKLSCNGLAN